MTYAKGMPGAARETLRWLVDHLPEAACETACQALLDHLKKTTPCYTPLPPPRRMTRRKTK